MRGKGKRHHVKGARGTDRFKDKSRTHVSRVQPYETCSGLGGTCVLDKQHHGPCSGGDGDEQA